MLRRPSIITLLAEPFDSGVVDDGEFSRTEHLSSLREGGLFSMNYIFRLQILFNTYMSNPIITISGIIYHSPANPRIRIVVLIPVPHCPALR